MMLYPMDFTGFTRNVISTIIDEIILLGR